MAGFQLQTPTVILPYLERKASQECSYVSFTNTANRKITVHAIFYKGSDGTINNQGSFSLDAYRMADVYVQNATGTSGSAGVDPVAATETLWAEITWDGEPTEIIVAAFHVKGSGHVTPLPAVTKVVDV